MTNQDCLRAWLKGEIACCRGHANSIREATDSAADHSAAVVWSDRARLLQRVLAFMDESGTDEEPAKCAMCGHPIDDLAGNPSRL